MTGFSNLLRRAIESDSGERAGVEIAGKHGKYSPDSAPSTKKRRRRRRTCHIPAFNIFGEDRESEARLRRPRVEAVSSGGYSLLEIFFQKKFLTCLLNAKRDNAEIKLAKILPYLVF